MANKLWVTTRLIARAGLSLALIGWVLGQWASDDMFRPDSTRLPAGPVTAFTAITPDAFMIILTRTRPGASPNSRPYFTPTHGWEQYVVVPGVYVKPPYWEYGRARVDHRFAVLFFLTLTLLTWRKGPAKSEEAATQSSDSATAPVAAKAAAFRDVGR